MGHVNDFAHFLSNSQRQRLESKLRNYRDTTSTVIAIATVNSLGGQSIQQVGTALFSKWDLWQGNKDNGVLILIAKQEQRVRIEVGYGLEGAITDAMSGRIIRNVISPAFKKGDYYEGLDQATTILIKMARGEFKGTIKKKDNGESGNTASGIIFLLFIAYVIYASSRRGGDGKNGGRRQRTLGPGGMMFLGGMLGGGFGGGGLGGSSGGGGFGGFSGGGGFGSGGGGASGGW